MSPEDAEEYTAGLTMIGAGWWKQIALGVRLDVPKKLGLSRAEWRSRVAGGVQIAAVERPAAVAELAADGMSQREIADVLGVSVGTVNGDLPRSDLNVERDEAHVNEPERSGLNTEREPAPHVTHNTGNDEWYTPPEYIHAARDVLGGIDLDPASSPVANDTVKAERYYTIDDDGLTRPWQGRVWMNPPYSTGLVDKFVFRLLDAYQSGDVKAAAVLTNNATDTRWWQALARRSSAVCMLAGRIRFRGPDGAVAGAGLQGQTIALLGDDRQRFLERFAEFGVVL